MNFIICSYLVLFVYAAQSADTDNIFEIRTKEKMKPVIDFIDRTYENLKSQSIRSSNAVEREFERMKTYEKILKGFMGFTEFIMNRTLVSEMSKVKAEFNKNPSVNFSGCEDILNKVYDDINVVKLNASNCFKNHQASAKKTEVEILKISNETLSALNKLKNESDKCSKEITDIKKAFDCVDTFKGKTESFIGNNVSNVTATINKNLNSVTKFSLNKCLEDQPMRKVQRRLSEEITKVDKCIEDLRKIKKKIDNTSSNSTTLKPENSSTTNLQPEIFDPTTVMPEDTDAMKSITSTSKPEESYTTNSQPEISDPTIITPQNFESTQEPKDSDSESLDPESSEEEDSI